MKRAFSPDTSWHTLTYGVAIGWYDAAPLALEDLLQLQAVEILHHAAGVRREIEIPRAIELVGQQRRPVSRGDVCRPQQDVVGIAHPASTAQAEAVSRDGNAAERRCGGEDHGDGPRGV